jgi:uncharacterized protein DUF4352
MNGNRRAAALVVAIMIISALGLVLVREANAPLASPHMIAIEKVAIDQVDAKAGSMVYVVVTNESNLGKENWNVNSASFQVVSNTSSTYSEVSTSVSAANVAIAIAPGQHRAMNLAFQLPGDQHPAQLVYDDQAAKAEKTILVPSASGWISKFNDFTNVAKTGNGSYVSGVVAFANVLNTTYPSFTPNSEAVSFSFFTGDRVTVGIELLYYKQPPDPASITVNSVTSTDGFQVVGIRSSATSINGITTVTASPGLPVTLTGWGSRAEILVTFLAPDRSYSGGVHFEIGFNSSAA